MKYKKQEIKRGINLHTIDTNKFKTNLIAVFLTTPLSRDVVTKSTLLNMVLRRGTKNLKSQEEISIALEELYGASFDCGIEKTGDNHIMKFYMETLNNEYIPEGEDILTKSIDTLFDVIFNPLIQNGGFKEEYIDGEKNNIKQIIDGKKDNKASYSLERCIEEMYTDKPYGLYKYGYIEDIDKIDNKSLINHYNKLISECKIDIFISGDIKEDISDKIKNNEKVVKLNERTPKYISNEEGKKAEENIENVVTENMDVMQGRLILGLDIKETSLESKYTALIYNAILGGTANSKLFQNVREKANLAYVASSNYLKTKDNIFIRSGIEIENYDKALNIIKEQLDDMKSGKFTDEDIDNAKQIIISSINAISDEQDTEITYYLGQELAGSNVSFEEYIQRVNNVSKDDIIKLSNKIDINTIYFLRD